MKLFVMGEDGVVVLNKEAATLYPNIRKIITRDRGGKVTGDPDGRFKFYAFREFTYVYFACDFEAYPSQHGLNEQETHLYAAKQSKLGKDYKPDEVVLALMKQYKEEHLTLTKQSIQTLLRVFTINDRIVKKIETNLTATLELPTLTAAQIKELLEYQQQLVKIAVEVPSIAKKLREAINLLEEEAKIIEKIRGGEDKPTSMDPNNIIEG